MDFMSLDNPASFLLVIAMIFIISEFFFLSYGLLALVGVILLVVCGILMAGAVPAGIVWGLAVLGLMVAGGSAWLVIRMQRKQITTGPESMVGREAIILQWKDQEGFVSIQGERWKAFSAEPLSLRVNDRVRVGAVQGLSVKIIASYL